MNRKETRMKMDPEVKAEWLALLRSGELKQGTGSLRYVHTDTETGVEHDRYCCLGVLCRVMEGREVLPPPTRDPLADYVWRYPVVMDDCPHDSTSPDPADHPDRADHYVCVSWEQDLLPSVVVRAAGLEQATKKDVTAFGKGDVVVTYRGKTRTLTDLNDELCLDFNQIADLIEEQL